MTATITNASGQVVRTIEIGGLTAGVPPSQDGSLDDGSTAPDGAYKVAINAKGNGEQLVARSLHFGLVNGVIRDGNGAKLDLGTAGNATTERRATDLITLSIRLNRTIA